MTKIARIPFNALTPNTVRMNSAGQSRTSGKTPIRWEDYLATFTDRLTIPDAKANSIVSLRVRGGARLSGTPTPTAPATIIANRGALSYGPQTANLLEVKDANIIVGHYINNAGVVTASLPNLYFQRFVAVKASTAYTLSTSEALNYANFMEYDADGVFIKRTLYGSSSTPAGKVVTHTMGASTAFVIIGSNINATKYPEVTKDDVKGIKWMFNKGTSAKTYEAYRAGYSYGGQDTISIEGGSSATASLLLGVGSYADAQDIITGQYRLAAAVVAFDGTENISQSGSSFTIAINGKLRSKTTLLCSHFAYTSATSSAMADLTVMSYASQNIGIRYDACADVEAFRQFLQREYAKGTPVTIVYPRNSVIEGTDAPQPLANPAGTVTLIRSAAVPGLENEVALKVRAAEEEGDGGGDTAKPNGVYVQHVDGKLYTTDEWAAAGLAAEQANGVAVISDAARFVIAKTDIKSTKLWASNTSDLIDGVNTAAKSADAKLDYEGANNTQKMLAIDKSGAGYSCNAYVFPNGANGYLPGAGELSEVYSNKAAINAALTAAGGSALLEGSYWASTQRSAAAAYSVSLKSGTVDSQAKNQYTLTRAFATL